MAIMRRNSRVADASEDAIPTLSKEEAELEFDRQSRRWLEMSGEEFLKHWNEGSFPNPNDPHIVFVSMLLPLIR